jgi:hypothetical protein
MPTVLVVALPAAHAVLPAVRADIVAAHAVIPAVRAAIAVVLVAASAAAVAMRAATAVAAAIRAASAEAVAMVAVAAALVAAAMAAADTGKQLRFSSKRLACFGRRAFFLRIQTLSMGFVNQRSGLLGKDFNARHGGVALHGNEVQKQFALGIRPQVRKLANDHVGLARLPGKVEVFEQRISIAEDIKDMSDRRPVLAGGG